MRSGGLRGTGGCGGGRQGGAAGQSAGRTAGQAAGYTAQRASGRASGRAMMWDDSHTDHVRVSVRDTRSGPLWIENRVIHISGISRWISTRLIHLVGINECITWGYPLACVNVNLPLGKQRATGTFVVEKLRTFPRSDEVPARAESELPTVPPTCRGYPHGTSSIRPQGPAARGAKMDTFEARNDHSGTPREYRVLERTNSPRKASISAPPHAPVTLRVTAQRRLEVPRGTDLPSSRRKLGRSGRPIAQTGQNRSARPYNRPPDDQICPVHKSNSRICPVCERRACERIGTGRTPGQAPGRNSRHRGQSIGTTHADRTYELAQCADKVAA